jgi:hypothetical protein
LAAASSSICRSARAGTESSGAAAAVGSAAAIGAAAASSAAAPATESDRMVRERMGFSDFRAERRDPITTHVARRQ